MPPDPGGTPSPRVIAATIGLGAIPRGQTRHEREIARAYMAFRRLLASWSYWELNPIRRRTLNGTADHIEQSTRRAQRPTIAASLRSHRAPPSRHRD